MYRGKSKKVNCLSSLTKEEVTNKSDGKLQNKVWNPGKLTLTVNCNDVKSSGELQHKVWDPRKQKTLTKKGCSKENEQLQHKVWDPGGLKAL